MNCWISLCGEPVELETSQTDHNGKPSTMNAALPTARSRNRHEHIVRSLPGSR
jgi:hypothetical protein